MWRGHNIFVPNPGPSAHSKYIMCASSKQATSWRRATWAKAVHNEGQWDIPRTSTGHHRLQGAKSTLECSGDAKRTTKNFLRSTKTRIVRPDDQFILSLSAGL